MPAQAHTTSQETAAHAERALLQQVIEHDEQAFTRLYSRYAPMLQRFLARALSQASLVDEVLNDVMLVLWQKAAEFPTHVSLGAWLCGIARHKAQKAWQRQAADVPLPEDYQDMPESTTPEVLLLQQEQVQQLEHELAALPPSDRLLLEKLLYQGCSYQEMADQTGTPLNTVKARIARARQRLVQRCAPAWASMECAA